MKQVFTIALIFLLFSCKQNSSTESKQITEVKDTVIAPLQTEKVVKQESGSDFSKSYEEQTISTTNSDSATTIMMRSKSTVKIWKKTFVYADDNKPVTEDVVIKYREIKQATDAIGSSISMIYDSAGVKQNFESAGMFEFYAYTKTSGRIVKIAKGKSIEVNYATDAKDDDYNLYKYQTGAENWTYLSRASQSIKGRAKSVQKIEIVEPVKPNRPSNNGSAFDLDIDVDKFPELNSYRGIVWEYAAESKAANPSDNKWIFVENWTNVNLEAYSKMSGCYKITLKSKKKTFTTVIKPALTGNDFDVAMQKYQKAMVKYQSLHAQKSKTITLKISDFGIYNIDRIASIKNKYTIEADFVLENSKEDISGRTVYLIYNNNRNVISYTKNGVNAWHKFTFDAKAQDNNLLVIMPNNIVAIGHSADFEIIKKNHHKTYRFKLKLSDKAIENISELNSVF